MHLPDINISATKDALDALADCIDIHYESTGLPFVTLTYAQTLDGSIAASDGAPMAISCHEALVFTHRLRAMHDAILVGIGTVISDNPRLNTRLVEGESPIPVILDSCLRIDQQARVLHASDRKPIIFTTQNQLTPRIESLEEHGVEVLWTRKNTDGAVDLGKVLKQLGNRGIKSLMVEGGSKVISSFLREGIVHRIIVTLSMQWMNGLRIFPTIEPGGAALLPTIMEPHFLHWAGSDLVIHGMPKWK